MYKFRLNGSLFQTMCELIFLSSGDDIATICGADHYARHESRCQSNGELHNHGMFSRHARQSSLSQNKADVKAAENCTINLGVLYTCIRPFCMLRKRTLRHRQIAQQHSFSNHRRSLFPLCLLPLPRKPAHTISKISKLRCQIQSRFLFRGT